MFTVNEVPILADDISVIYELRDQLKINGIELFHTVKETTSNIQVTCPIHNNGQERRPSCGISRVRQERDGVIIPAGTVHCFSCGYSASLPEMISYCFGKDDFGKFGIKWLVRNFQTVAVEERKDLELDLDRKNNHSKEESFVEEAELDRYRFYHPYMWERKLTKEIVEIFDVGYDDNFVLFDKVGVPRGTFRCLTFPVLDISGNCVFVARRSVDTKMFHYPSDSIKPVYGLFETYQHYPDCQELIVCESILNALTCWVYGRPAVALNGTGTPYQYEQLLKFPCRKYITAFDPDDAGSKATGKFREYVGKKKLVTSFDISVGKDLNDLTKNEFESLVEFF